MSRNIFRNKSIDRISSPEQLNGYVRVSNPGVWVTLVAILILIAGICVWGIFGSLDTLISTVAVVNDDGAVCYVKEGSIRGVEEGMTVDINGEEYIIESISQTPVPASSDMGSYALHVGSLSEGEWVYEVKLATSPNNGIYKCKIVVESVRPMSFLWN